MSENLRDAGASQGPSVVVGLATFRRPADLERILPGLVAQASALTPPGRVVVVDNDPDGGAREQVAAHADVTYVHEPKPGIAAARNAALDEAAEADAIVFVDDDEEVTDGWLATLVACWQRYGCQAVAGPVTTVFDDGEPEPYVARCGVFDTVVRPTGTVIPGAATNNLLLDLAWLRAHDLRFDDRFGLSGGSDGLLTRTLTSQGGEIRWCAEAMVLDHIPSSRTTREWVRHRVARQANSWARTLVALEPAGAPKLKRRAWLLSHAAVLAARGGVARAKALRSGDQVALAHADMNIGRARGCAEAARGSVRFDYRRSN